MQLAMAARLGGIAGGSSSEMGTRVSPRILDQLLAAMRSGPMHDLCTSLGPWSVSNLYVGPGDTLAPCHWDSTDNFFLQLHGCKRVLMFAPNESGLRPFPNGHPYASRAQVKIRGCHCPAANYSSSPLLDAAHTYLLIAAHTYLLIAG